MNIEKKYDFKKESDMYGWFNNLFFNELKFFYHKMTDASSWYKPYDWIMANNSWTYHIEYKILDYITDDVYKSLRCNQRFPLWQISNFWWNAMVVVYYRDIDDLVVYHYWKREEKLSLNYLTQRQDPVLPL